VYIDGGSTHCTNVAKYLQKRRESNLLQQGDYKKKKKKAKYCTRVKIYGRRLIQRGIPRPISRRQKSSAKWLQFLMIRLILHPCIYIRCVWGGDTNDQV
jgi:hypothetical protein